MFIRCRFWVCPALIVSAALIASACGSSSRASEQTKSTVTIVAAEASNFDTASAKLYPKVSLALRTSRAGEVCDSIHSDHDDVAGWLISTKKSSATLVSFATDPGSLQIFAGLAIKSVCPQYMEQIKQGLAGTPSGINLGKPVPGSASTSAASST